MTSPSPSGGDDAIHLYSNSGTSLSAAVDIMLAQLENRIGNRFRMVEGNTNAIIDDSTAPCGCPPVSAALVENKLLDIDARLQHVEKNLSVIMEPIEPSDLGSNAEDPPSTDRPSANIWPTLLRIERTLQPIEKMTIRRTVETAADAPLADDSPPPFVFTTTETPEQATTEILELGRSTPAPIQPDMPGTGAHETETTASDSTSPAESYRGSVYSDDVKVITPSLTATVRSATQWINPDEAAELNRDLMRVEINRALAGAMGNLVRMLEGGEV